jgi:YjbE family integral membrane protein
MELLQSTDFWIGLIKIIWINIILSGDNAVVIALAARSLPPAQQKKAILFGSGAAVVLRIALTVVAAKLLELSYLQIIGGMLLLWIGVQLLGDEEDGESEGKEYGSLMGAVRTILIADLVMSLDNVIAVAAAAKGSTTLLILGLAISIPLVIFGKYLDDQADGPLSDHHHPGRGLDRLGRRRNHCQRCSPEGIRRHKPLDSLCSRSGRRHSRGCSRKVPEHPLGRQIEPGEIRPGTDRGGARAMTQGASLLNSTGRPWQAVPMCLAMARPPVNCCRRNPDPHGRFRCAVNLSNPCREAVWQPRRGASAIQSARVRGGHVRSQ